MYVSNMSFCTHYMCKYVNSDMHLSPRRYVLLRLVSIRKHQYMKVPIRMKGEKNK